MTIEPQETTEATQISPKRRALLKKVGRFAAVTAPAVTLLLAAASKPAKAFVPSGLSSRQLKMADGILDSASVLGALGSLQVDRWCYKPRRDLGQQAHIGPYAEDFKAAFGVGDGVTVSTIDAIGVCLASIKALHIRVQSLEAML